MDSVQSSIRAEVSRGPSPVLKGAEAFSAYAIASAKGLIPEMEYAARLTLDHPMTFETLGEGLRLFESWALGDLFNFRRRCGESFIACLDLFLKVQPPGPSSIWGSCPGENVSGGAFGQQLGQCLVLPKWLNQLFSRSQNDLKLQKFTNPLDIHSRIRDKYLKALQNHAACNFCSGVHIRNGSTFCVELENKLLQARDKVVCSFYFKYTRLTSLRYVVIGALSLTQLIQFLGISEAS